VECKYIHSRDSIRLLQYQKKKILPIFVHLFLLRYYACASISIKLAVLGHQSEIKTQPNRLPWLMQNNPKMQRLLHIARGQKQP
jgi:hypothetical protein